MVWNYREVQIMDDEVVVDSGTKTVDLNLKDPITSLIIRFKVVNTSALSNQPAQRVVSKIEIVDGGQVYYSLSGPQAVAASAYALGRYPTCWIDGRPGNNQRMNFQLLFGRQLGDEEFAFNPSRLLNPQLKVTWAKHATHTTNLVTLGVTARIMEDLATPAQALMWKEVEAWVTAAEGVHKVDLPTDYPIRALMMRTWAQQILWTQAWSRFKLDCDLGKLIPFDLDSAEFGDITKSFAGPFHVMQHGTWSYNDLIETWLGETLMVSGIALQPANYVNFMTAGAWSWFFAYIMNNANVTQDDALCQAFATGYYPESCILYPFGDLDKPETWFPAQIYGEIALKITEAYLSNAASVCVQQPRPIP